jgi:guanylate kinase
VSSRPDAGECLPEAEDSFLPSPFPLVVVLSGPSGVGKDAVLTQMRDQNCPFFYTVTATTRPQRPGEIDGVHYHFIGMEQFNLMVKEGELLEWAQVYGNYYGVPKAPVLEARARGQDVIIKADVQGAATIKCLAPEAVFIFLAPPSIEELATRLRLRKTESPEAYAMRLQTAREEMKSLPMFDYVVVNSSQKLDLAVQKILDITVAEKCRVYPRRIDF